MVLFALSNSGDPPERRSPGGTGEAWADERKNTEGLRVFTVFQHPSNPEPAVRALLLPARAMDFLNLSIDLTGIWRMRKKRHFS